MSMMKAFSSAILLAAVAPVVLADCLPGDPFYIYPNFQQTAPSFITLVGHNGGTVDPYGEFTVIARDYTGQPAGNVPVSLFYGPCSDIRICTSQMSGTSVNCNTTRATRYTDIYGYATFRVMGGTTNSGSCSSGAGALCGAITVCGSTATFVTIAVADQDGINGVDSNDMSLILDDLGCGTYYGRSDFDGDGELGSNDLSVWLDISGSGSSAESCGTFTPSGSYCP